MSEILPNPEKEPMLSDNCDNCQKDYELTNENSAGYHYNKQPECDFLFCVCPHCKSQIKMFTNQETIERARTSGITILEEEAVADQNTYNQWLELNGIELVQPVEITNRHEALIRQFGEALLNIPDELFWNNIEAETNKPYNQKWID